ncbi:hypothetical protein [Acinetobacter beijerinckii]|uniref:Uncharacterized protein n=1 Tax=Acinetobacter beijerinckii CIP 110307 TaxID=1217648 RepID=N9FS89_9GAMM|nr:hypothetical protein [Acinetobacter beijerinckii]ENW07831.1 hypothetical protein F933_01027 [Acinetobacter beijerinckii CIP 110307]
MTAFTHMQMTMQEEDNLPNLAVQAFRDAFKQASESSAVVFTKDHQLIEKLPSGKINVIKDISMAYTRITVDQKVLKPKRKQVVI